jgi:hypothetical protein
MKRINMKKINQIIPFKSNEFTVKYADENSFKHAYKLKKSLYTYNKKTNTYKWFIKVLLSSCLKYDNLPKIKSDLENDIYNHTETAVLLEVKVSKKDKSTGLIKINVWNMLSSFYGVFQFNPTTTFNYYDLNSEETAFIPYKNYGKDLNWPLKVPMKIIGYEKNNTNQEEDIAKLSAYIYSI